MADFIAAALPELGNEDRRRFHALGETQRSQLAHSLLLLEAVELLEAYLNGRGEFAATGAPPAPARLHQLAAICQELDVAPPATQATGAAAVAAIWQQLLPLCTAPPAAVELIPSTVALAARGEYQAHVSGRVREITALFRPLELDVLAFGYHGSIGSGDHIAGLSDCDTLLLLRSGVAADAARLERVGAACRQALPLMQQIDRFQHHGVFVLPEELFPCYPEQHFPLVLFPQTSFDLGAGGALALRVLHSPLLAAARCLRWAQFLQQAAAAAGEHGYYYFHEVLQVAQLLPCFTADACERGMAKPEAIPWFNRRASEPSRTFLQTTTRLREEWPMFWRKVRRKSLGIGWLYRRVLLADSMDYFGGREAVRLGLSAIAQDARRLCDAGASGAVPSPPVS